MLVLGTLFQMLSFGMQSFAPQFPVFVASFAIGGIGMAIQVSYLLSDNFVPFSALYIGRPCKWFYCISAEQRRD